MNITEKSTIPLEILIATMNRTSLGFLDGMFKNVNSSECHLLIVNQTTPKALLVSNLSNIRVINSFEQGLSKSRNLGLQNAEGNIVLIADDDLVFVKGFQESILKAFDNYKNAALISFQIFNTEGNAYRNYPSAPQMHSLQSIENIMSVEMALNMEIVKDKNIQFDTNFGLGSHFETAEEFIFTREIVKDGLSAYFYDKFIASHPRFNSGQEAGNDRIIYARAALQYKLHQQIAYLWLPKYLFFLLRHKYIQLKDLKHKFSVGLKGIKDYKIIYKNENS